jgi:hypothetical protein
VFIGATDLAEIAYLTLQGTGITLAAVLDDDRIGKEFINHTVQATDRVGTIDFDRILITATESFEHLRERLQNLEVDNERILMIR